MGYIKAIGLTLDEILRDELRPNMTLNSQSVSIKISAAITILFFVGGLINSVLSLVTFQNEMCRQVGCGMYLLVSSVTSFLTVIMFTIKFWFVVLSQTNVSTSLSVLGGGCASIEVTLKFFLYLDGWFNACVAAERAVQVFKGVNFDKKKSKYYAQRIILILPFCIIATLAHELIYRRLLVYQPETDKDDEGKTSIDTLERYISCVARYSPAVQEYNTTILFFHLVAPFLANLCSALFIIFGTARRRSAARADKLFQEHVREQFKEHKQLIISPVVLFVLSIPRLIISLLPDRVQASENLWLYLSAYFISFVPSMLIFAIFVLPSELYMKAFKQSFKCVQRLNHIRQ